MEWSGRRRHGGQGRRPHWRPITGSGTVRPGPGFTVRFALFTWTSALLSRHEVTPKIHRRTSMAYVTWKLVFLYDNNKNIYLNKYPYTMELCRLIKLSMGAACIVIDKSCANRVVMVGVRPICCWQMSVVATFASLGHACTTVRGTRINVGYGKIDLTTLSANACASCKLGCYRGRLVCCNKYCRSRQRLLENHCGVVSSAS